MDTQNKRRDRLSIIAEILSIAKDAHLKTQIMYRANLSFAQLSEYLDFLTKIGLLTVHEEIKKTTYETSDKGNCYLEKYMDISSLLGTE